MVGKALITSLQKIARCNLGFRNMELLGPGTGQAIAFRKKREKKKRLRTVFFYFVRLDSHSFKIKIRSWQSNQEKKFILAYLCQDKIHGTKINKKKPI